MIGFVSGFVFGAFLYCLMFMTIIVLRHDKKKQEKHREKELHKKEAWNKGDDMR